MDLAFIHQKQDIVMIGNPGVGKSHLAKCYAYAATQAGIKTLFTSAMDMINNLIALWSDIFDGNTAASAIADRLVYNSEILILEGASYRKRI